MQNYIYVTSSFLGKLLSALVFLFNITILQYYFKKLNKYKNRICNASYIVFQRKCNFVICNIGWKVISCQPSKMRSCNSVLHFSSA
jgi:hypothetical protein